MERVVQELGQILLRAVPTFVLVLLLYLFLKKVFFNPLHSVLQRRYQDSEGAMKEAAEAMALAQRKTSEHEHALREARAEIFRFLESERNQTLEECNQLLRQARAQAEQHMQAAREQLQADVEAAKKRLSEQTDELAEDIAHTVLKLKAETAS